MSQPGVESPATQNRPTSELDRSLLALGEKALSEGKAKEAAGRFRRVLARSPQSVEARVGLARAEIAQGNLDAARDTLGADSSASANPDVLVAWSEVYRRSGDTGAESRVLARILSADPTRYGLHQRLSDLTGPAPATLVGKSPVTAAELHPYDSKALLAGARQALAEGDSKTAGRWLTRVVWLADEDPQASRRAMEQLSALDPAWKERRVVPVHIYADQTIRSDPGWRARMRLVWRSLSVALDPLLQLVFVPVSMSDFDSSSASSALSSIEQAFRRTAGPLPASGMIAAFTERPPPQVAGMWRAGVAEFLGRVMVMRLEPGELASRTLAHEAFHIYGGVHVSDERGSLMNPSGNSLNVDPSNQVIARIVRERRFGPGGVDANVLPYVDVAALTDAYLGALSWNLAARQRGLDQAASARSESRYIAARLGKDATLMDPNLADVSAFTAVLLLRQGRNQEAGELFGAAGRLYGLQTPKGQEMIRRSERLRAIDQ